MLDMITNEVLIIAAWCMTTVIWAVRVESNVKSNTKSIESFKNIEKGILKEIKEVSKKIDDNHAELLKEYLTEERADRLYQPKQNK